MRVSAVLAAGLLVLTAAAASAQQVQLTISNGRVSLFARDATLRQILTEWSRVGQTKIVNLERIPGGPLTLQLVDQPEDQALDTLLRSLSGYVAAQRPTPVANLSRYDRIMVMPTPAPPRTAMAAPLPVPIQQPTQQAPVDDDEDRPVNVVMPARGPIFPTPTVPQPGLQPQMAPAQQPGARPATVGVQGQPQLAQPPAAGQQPAFVPAAPASAPAAMPPAGSSTPGVVIQPPPTQPGQIIQRPSSD